MSLGRLISMGNVLLLGLISILYESRPGPIHYGGLTPVQKSRLPDLRTGGRGPLAGGVEARPEAAPGDDSGIELLVDHRRHAK
jgi:hypothetical protein